MEDNISRGLLLIMVVIIIIIAIVYFIPHPLFYTRASVTVERSAPVHDTVHTYTSSQSVPVTTTTQYQETTTQNTIIH